MTPSIQLTSMRSPSNRTPRVIATAGSQTAIAGKDVCRSCAANASCWVTTEAWRRQAQIDLRVHEHLADTVAELCHHTFEEKRLHTGEQT